MEVDIIPFLEKIIDRTNRHICSWEKTGTDAYRLLLRNGSVTIIKEKEPAIPLSLDLPVLYRLRIFDQADCFFSLDITNRSTKQFAVVDKLFESVRCEENRVINEKLSSLLKELS